MPNKQKLLFILPKNEHKQIDKEALVKSLDEYFDFKILTDDKKYSKTDEKIYFLDDITPPQTASTTSIPYAAVASDRFTLDYSNMGTIQGSPDLSAAVKTFEILEQEIKIFEPDYMVTQVCDNKLSWIAALACERNNIPAISLFVRPYLETRQMLINPRTFDNTQLKLIARKYFQGMKSRTAAPHSWNTYKKDSPKWAKGFLKRKLLSYKNYNALSRYIKTYGLAFLYRYAYSQYLKLNCQITVPDTPYILLPLHLQPEAVFLGTDNRFLDQASIISYVSFNIPINMQLIAKEHPAQKARPMNFYRRIKRLPNVTLVFSATDIGALIDNTVLVIVLSGNAGFEALKVGKKVILLGDSYYEDSPNCFKFDRSIALYKFIDEVIAAPLHPITEVNNYFAALERAIIENSVEITEKQLLNDGDVLNTGKNLLDLTRKYQENILLYGKYI